MFSSLSLIASGLWFGGTWIDSGDATCGSVFRYSRWTDGYPVECRGVMIGRSVIFGAAVIFGAMLAVVALRKSRVSDRWLVAGAAGLGVALLLLVVLNSAVSPA
jgi:hypothetical protein